MISVNRGLNDTIWASTQATVVDLGERLSDAAIATAKELRKELGMGF